MPAGGISQLIKTLAILLALFLVPFRPVAAGEREDREAAARLAEAVKQKQAESAERADIEREIAETRRQVQELTAKLAVLSRKLADDRSGGLRFFSVTTSNRAAIGIVVKTQDDPDSDKLGATVVAITPGGAAEAAGLEPGDIITRYNDIRLTQDSDRPGDDESAPAMRLIERARQLQAGDKVHLVYVRDGREHQADLVASELPLTRLDTKLRQIRIQSMGVGSSAAFAPRWTERGFDEFENLELVELNPDLGGYFGVKDGVLVVQAPDESVFKIRPGDVLLRVGDFRPRTPQEAFTFLHRNEPGKPIKIEVLRKGNTVKLTSLLPDDSLFPEPPPPPKPPRRRD